MGQAMTWGSKISIGKTLSWKTLSQSWPCILPPKTEVLQYSTNYISILDQADDPHLRASSRAGQGIKLPDHFDKLSPDPKWISRKRVIWYVQYGEISAILFFGWFISRSWHSILTPLPFCPVWVPALVTHHSKAVFRDMLRNPGYEFLCWNEPKVLPVLAVGHVLTVQ